MLSRAAEGLRAPSSVRCVSKRCKSPVKERDLGDHDALQHWHASVAGRGAEFDA